MIGRSTHGCVVVFQQPAQAHLARDDSRGQRCVCLCVHMCMHHTQAMMLLPHLSEPSFQAVPHYIIREILAAILEMLNLVGGGHFQIDSFQEQAVKLPHDFSWLVI